MVRPRPTWVKSRVCAHGHTSLLGRLEELGRIERNVNVIVMVHPVHHPRRILLAPIAERRVQYGETPHDDFPCAEQFFRPARLASGNKLVDVLRL